mgnify:CR=1 FL=1
MILKFKKGSRYGDDLPSSYQAQLPNGNTLELFKAGSIWLSHEAGPDGHPVKDEFGVELDLEEHRTKGEALASLREEYANKFNG